MSIHDETEADTRAEGINPVLAAPGWGQHGQDAGSEMIFLGASSKSSMSRTGSQMPRVRYGRCRCGSHMKTEEASWRSF